jgi:hypothetical protein
MYGTIAASRVLRIVEAASGVGQEDAGIASMNENSLEAIVSMEGIWVNRMGLKEMASTAGSDRDMCG